MAVSPKINPVRIGCPLVQHLRYLSCESGGVEAAFAGALLGDLGYFTQNQADPHVGNMSALLNFLITEGHATALTGMSSLCTQCQYVSDCDVGDVILKT